LGLTVFTLASAGAALAPSVEWLVAARAAQGVGGAMVLPLTLTMLSAAVPPARRGAALGAWGAVNGVAVALGPLVGGAVVQGLAWQWIFWVNVPIGIVLVPVVLRRLPHSLGVPRSLDLPGVALATAGLLGVVYGLVRGNALGWTSTTVLASVAAGVVLLVAFVTWERRASEPVLPLAMFGSRSFSAANGVSVLFSFGMFGSIFLLAQYLQTVQGSTPLEAGLKTLPWTAMPLLVAPVAGPLSDRIGGRPLLVTGLALQALGLGWLAATMTTSTPYTEMVPAFALSGIGMGMVFAPLANVVLGGVDRSLEGIASGTNNALREIGGVFGVAALASVFSGQGGYESRQTFVDGTVPALWVGAVAVGTGALAGLLIPRRGRHAAVAAVADRGAEAEPVPLAVPAPA
ncbi:MAG TPA: DHA2 family efflux MFS transporter permease subunit, partial [Jiangellales bacterium]|nr:DHA2 family efflux MFS transporter permease subunit [Jiangellales bacterium]